MRTSLEVENILYQILNVPELTEQLGGKIFKGFRPPQRQIEDIVVGCLTVPNKTVQNGYANVNLYCPSLGIGLPNHKRFDEVLGLVKGLLEQGEKEQLYYKIDNISSILEDPDNKEMHYINIRINYQIR